MKIDRKSLIQHLDRIFSDEYMPTWEDVLAVSIPTKGIQDFSFQYDGLSFCISAFGGYPRIRRRYLK